MKDLSEAVQRYRLALRELWNRSFWGDAELREFWHLEEMFDAVKKPLFRVLVLSRLSANCGTCGDPASTIPVLYAVPNVPTTEDNDAVAELTLLRKKYNGWDSEGTIGRVRASRVRLSFIDVFEWGNIGFRDFRYYRVHVDAADDRPDVVGREALVDVYEVSIFGEPEI